MDTRRNLGWLVVGLYLVVLGVVDQGCSASSERGGEGGDGGDSWGNGGGNPSGTGGESSSVSSSSGKPCSGPESCNGVDDDCNGKIDDNVASVGNACNTGLMGICGEGAVDCQGGKPLCTQTVSPTDEICDNLDNDCNGTVDDNIPGGGMACMTGLPGPCALGMMGCLGGAMGCVQQNQAVPEICGDMVDNDCDGTADDGCGMPAPCSHNPCLPGAPLNPDCAPCVKVICNIDSFCCSTQWDLTCSTKAADMCPGC